VGTEELHLKYRYKQIELVPKHHASCFPTLKGIIVFASCFLTLSSTSMYLEGSDKGEEVIRAGRAIIPLLEDTHKGLHRHTVMYKPRCTRTGSFRELLVLSFCIELELLFACQSPSGPSWVFRMRTKVALVRYVMQPM
jgi:hypothetical protein